MRVIQAGILTLIIVIKMLQRQQDRKINAAF